MRGLMNLKNKLLSSMNISWFTELSIEIIFRSTSPRLLSFKAGDPRSEPREENNLVNYVTSMDTNINMAKKQQPAVLRKQLTNEDDLKHFLHSKGFDREAVASIISRYPRSTIRSYNSLQERWEIWQNILISDLEIIKVLKRYPESFFRSENNKNMQQNIVFFLSLGLTSKDLAKILKGAPRVFSSSVELNKQIVDLLKETYVYLGGKDPHNFVKNIILRNIFILLRSKRQVAANIQFLKSILNVDNEELRMILHGRGSEILDLSNEYLKKTHADLKNKLLLHGYTEAGVSMIVRKHPRVLYLSSRNVSDKIDLLFQSNINLHEIMKKPLILDKSIKTLSSRIDVLTKLHYDFEAHGIGILELSQLRFEAKLKKLQCHVIDDTQRDTTFVGKDK